MSSVEKSPVPEWLNDEFLEGILRNYYKNNEIKVINSDVKSISANGEGFLSSMYKAAVNFEFSPDQQSTVHLIVKAAIAGLVDAFSTFDVYEKEVDFYDNVAPKINEKLKELNEPQLLPECFGVCKKRKIMVMEDLKANGYNVLTNQNEYFQAKVVLKRTAVFNAIGVALREEDSDIFANFKSGHLTRDVDVCNNLYKGLYDALLDTISAWPEFAAHSDKMRIFRENLVERWHQAYDVNPNHFNALVHNDLWPPNVMTKGASSSEEAPFENVVFIDFQNTLWGSPTIDLHFFLNMSLCDSSTPNQFDELVRFYHSHLVSCLQRLNYKGHIPTWVDFFAQYQERKIIGFILHCLDQAVTIDNTGDVGYEILLENNEKSMEIKRQLYQKPKVQAILRKMIPYYDQIGTFD